MCPVSLHSLNCIIAFATEVIFRGSRSPSRLWGSEDPNPVPGRAFFVRSLRDVGEKSLGRDTRHKPGLRETAGNFWFSHLLARRKNNPGWLWGGRRGRFSPLLSVSQFVESDAAPGLPHQPGSSPAANERAGRVDGCALISSAALLRQERPHFHLL